MDVGSSAFCSLPRAANVIQDSLPDRLVCAATVDRGRRNTPWAQPRAETKHAASTLKRGCETSRVGGATEIQVKERTDRVDDNARHQGRGPGEDSARRWGCIAAGKVVRTALQDAASIAGLLITT